MIESRFWKVDLLNHAKKLKKRKEIKRWSEKSQVNFEKEIIISFFLIRKLIEANKISKAVKKTKIQLLAYPRTNKQLTNRNHWDVRELYDFDNPKNVTKGIVFLSNQLIHSLTIFAIRKDKNGIIF